MVESRRDLRMLSEAIACADRSPIGIVRERERRREKIPAVFAHACAGIFLLK